MAEEKINLASVYIDIKPDWDKFQSEVDAGGRAMESKPGMKMRMSGKEEGKGIFEGLMDKGKEKGQGLLDGIFGGGKKAAGGKGGGLFGGMMGGGKGMAGLAKIAGPIGIIVTVLMAIKKLIEMFVKNSEAFRMLKEGISDFMGAIVDTLVAILLLGFLQLLQKLQPFIEWLGQSKLWEWLSSGVAGLWAWLSKGTAGLWDWLKVGEHDFFGWLSRDDAGTWAWMSEGVAGLWAWLSDGTAGLWEWLDDGTAKLWEWLKDPPAQFWEWLIKDSIPELFAWLTNEGASVATEFFKWLTGTAGEGGGFGGPLFKWLTGGLENPASQFMKWLTTGIDNPGEKLFQWLTMGFAPPKLPGTDGGGLGGNGWTNPTDWWNDNVGWP